MHPLACLASPICTRSYSGGKRGEGALRFPGEEIGLGERGKERGRKTCWSGGGECAQPSLVGWYTNGVTLQLLLPTAPSLSIYDSLDPQLRYLMADSWSGLVGCLASCWTLRRAYHPFIQSGQISSAFALLYLAQQTQRIAILSVPLSLLGARLPADPSHPQPIMAR